MSKQRRFTFTLFNMPEADEVRHFMTQFNTKYWMAGDEVCPSSGKQHWQGWLYLNNPRTLRSMIKTMRPHHVEIMFATADQNEKYCTKDGKWISDGVKPAQGERGDLARAVLRTSVREHFEMDEPSFQSIRVLEKKLHYVGNGTVRVVESCDIDFEDVDIDDNTYVYQGSWRGYDGQELVLSWREYFYDLRHAMTGLPIRVDSGGGCSRVLNIRAVAFVRGTEQKSGGNTRLPPVPENSGWFDDY